MNKNGKIALGCGGAGCLGLVLIVIVTAVLIGTGVVKAPGIYSPNSNSNININVNSNRNSNLNSNANTNDSQNSNSDSTSSSMSDDDKHKLFQAAGITQDNDLILRVIRKIGFGDGTGAGYPQFLQDHGSWAQKNFDFIRSVLTKEKARAYVEEHIND